MKTINIIGFGGGLDQDELAFRIPHEYTGKMISHFRIYRYWLGVQIHISPMDDNSQINRNCDTFFIHNNGDEKKRVEIKQSINEFCEKQKLEPPTWPENY